MLPPRPSDVASNPYSTAVHVPRPADTPQRTPVPTTMGHSGDAAAVYWLDTCINDIAASASNGTREKIGSMTR